MVVIPNRIASPLLAEERAAEACACSLEDMRELARATGNRSLERIARELSAALRKARPQLDRL